MLFNAAVKLGLVKRDSDGRPSEGDVFHYFLDAGYTTSAELYYGLISAEYTDAFITSTLGHDNIRSNDAQLMRNLRAEARRICRAGERFDNVVRTPEDSIGHAPELARTTSAPQNAPKTRPRDRRSLRATLSRARTEFLAGGSEEVPSTVVSLMWHVRRAAGRTLLRASRAEQFHCQGVCAADWLSSKSLPTDSGTTEANLEAIEVTAVDLHRAVVENITATIGTPCADLFIKLQNQLRALKQNLVLFEPALLARKARQLHTRSSALCDATEALLFTDSSLPGDGNILSAASQEEAQRTQEADLTRAGITVKLSLEQWEAVECSSSIFLQGRSGTGKTIVLARRILHRHAEACKKQSDANAFPRLFVTKSTLLVEEVRKLLVHAGLQLSRNRWPPEGLVCLTWDQFIGLVMEDGSCRRATVDYTCFLASYWPRLRPKARQLPPQLVWAEFNNRLRSFSKETVKVDDYIKDDLAAVGIRLSVDDLKLLYELFMEYQRLKKSRRQLDDTDVALRLQELGLAACLSGLYIDEAQDFSPRELVVLLSLCHNPDGVTVVGDTCQTINPGSAFNFQEIADAFIKYGGKGRRPDAISQGMFEVQARQCRLLQLRVNYRCPAGVSALAVDVAQLLLERFPSCADRIEELGSACEGNRPLFVELPSASPGRCIMGDGSQSLSVLDPARNVILVRSDEARQKLRAQRVSGTVLTVAEAKGLEFDFVVLCNLLTECPDSSLWSLADEHSPETHAASFAASVLGDHANAISAQEHRRLCRIVLAIPELKSLYVAITRARVGCAWLECKPDSGVWAPLLLRWEKANLVELWSGTRSYVLEATSPERRTSQPESVGAGCSSADAGPSQVSDDRGVLMSWLQAELKKRQGRMQKTARNALSSELVRLRKGGEVDGDFRTTFEASFGIRPSASVEDTLVSNANAASPIDEFPSLVLALERRFGGDCVSRTPTTPEQLGFQMLAHAADNARERWQMFPEAQLALEKALKMADSNFTDQLPYLGVGPSPEPQQVVWRRQICAVLQEAMRPPSLTGVSAFARIKRLPVLIRIFTFIAPRSETCVQNACLMVAEQVREYCVSKDKLDRGILLAKAWHSFSQALYDPASGIKEDSLQSAVRDSLPADRMRRSHSPAVPPKQQQYITSHLLELHTFNLAKAEACANAGALFFAAQQHQLAAESFGEAANFAVATLEFIKSLRGYSSHFLGKGIAPAIVASERKACEHSARAADSWLLVARRVQCAGRIGERALLRGAEHLHRAGRSSEAAACAVRAGRPRRALEYLAASHACVEPSERSAQAQSTCLLCAALINELGVAYTPI